ncbi:DUF2625 family protein [Dermacoccaceae bacterium W4C1]
MTQPRSASELIDVSDPAWPHLRQVAEARESTRVLPVGGSGERVIERLQVTARSALGALALNCGGILVDHGWLRLLGGGSPGLPDLASANGLPSAPGAHQPPGAMLIGWDVLGGRFAIDGGALGVAPGQVCYFAPDSLRWESLGIGHTDFVHAMLSGAAAEFYASTRWSGWEREVTSLAIDRGYSLYPPPFSREGADVDRVARSAVPIQELFAFYDDAARQLNGPG